MKKIISIVLALLMMISIIPAGVVSSFAAEGEDGLLLYYDMKNQTVEDSVGSYDGTLIGNTSWTTGINGNAVVLGGGEDYILVPNAVFDTCDDAVTVSMWVKLNNNSTWSALFVAGSNDQNYAVFASKGNPRGVACGVTMEFNLGGTKSPRVQAVEADQPTVGEWSLVTYTQEGSKATIYLNGRQIAQDTANTTTITDVLSVSGADFRIGDTKMFPDPSLDGAVAEVKVYNRALTSDELTAEYNANIKTAALLALEDAKSSTDLGDLSNVTRNLTLKTTASNGVNITWTSSNEKYVAADGKVTLPVEGEGDQEIILTATFSSDKTEETLTKEFKFTLKEVTGSQFINMAAEYLERYVDYIINDGYELPTGAMVDENFDETIGCNIEWKIAEGEAEIKDGKIYKTEDSAERQALKLEAVISREDEEKTVKFDNVTLIDEYAGYILSFFGGAEGEAGDEKGAQKLHLAYSYDGINWVKLNDGYTVLPTTIGNGTVRDPYIMRKKDGTFAVVATQGWDTPQIYLWDSADLVNYDNERLVTVAKSGIDGITGERAWAPEASYDPINDRYVVYWSDPRAGANRDSGVCYANYTDDLINFSDPFEYFNPGTKAIDYNIVKWNGEYFMAYKEDAGQCVKMARSTSLEKGTFEKYTESITPPGTLEGPFVFKVNGEQKWFHYYDYYNEHKFGVSVTTDISTGEWESLGKSETMPTYDVRHGGVISVTQKELEAIIDGYDMTVTEINKPADVIAPVGATLNTIKLPETVEGVAKAGVQNIPVTWSGEFDGSKPGTYVLTGTLNYAYEIAEGVEVKINVIVDENYAAPIVYEAEDAVLGGQAVIDANPNASGGRQVENIMLSAEAVTFTVSAQHAGVHSVEIAYLTWSSRNFEIIVNGADPVIVNCPGSNVDWESTVVTTTVDLYLNAGENTVVFGNVLDDAAPNLDCITVDNITVEAKQAAVDTVEAAVTNLPDSVTKDNVTEVQEIVDKYNGLSDEQKKSLSDDAAKAIEDAQDALDEYKLNADKIEAQRVEDLIKAIGKVTSVDQEAKVFEARIAYNNLTDSQKALVSEASLKALTDAEGAIEQIKYQVAADEVVELIEALTEITDTDEFADAVEEARAAYDDLDAEAKKLVSADALKALEEAEKKVADSKPTVIKGDLTNDGKVTVSDILALKTIIMSGETPTADQLAVADLNATPDGKLTVSDILGIKAIIMG